MTLFFIFITNQGFPATSRRAVQEANSAGGPVLFELLIKPHGYRTGH